MTSYRHLISACVISLAVMASSARAADNQAAKSIIWRVTETGNRTYIADWSYDKDHKRFQGRWTNGSEAVLKVKKLDQKRIVLTRTDKEGMTAGLTARYVGRESGNLVKGTVEWTFNGETTHGTWQAYQLGKTSNNQVAPLDRTRYPLRQDSDDLGQRATDQVGGIGRGPVTL